MKIGLIATYQIYKDPTPVFSGVGILSLASVIEKSNFDCELEIIDLFEFFDILIKDEDEVLQQVVKKILTTNSDIIGFSTMVFNLPIAIRICELLKRESPKIVTLLGGPGSSFSAAEILAKFNFIDFIIKGEAEESFPLFTKALINNDTFAFHAIKGLVFRDKNENIFDNDWPKTIENIDELPIPNYKLCEHYNNINYKEKGRGELNIAIDIGRGCPYSCIFCSTSIFFNRNFRLKSIDRVIEEIDLALQNIKVFNKITFTHDLLTINKEYMIELCEKLKLKFPKLKWNCLTRIDSVDREMLQKMYDAGCNEVLFGVESHTEKMQKYLNKNLDLKNFKKLLIDIKEIGFDVPIFFYVIGFPECENESDIEEIFESIMFARAYNKKIYFFMFPAIPVSGSKMYEKWKDKLTPDKYNYSGLTVVPLGWKKCRNLSLRESTIFTSFYNIKVKGKSKILKYQQINFLINNVLEESFRFLYTLLGNNLVKKILSSIEDLEVEKPENIEANILDKTIKSTNKILKNLLKESEYKNYLEMFVAISDYETNIYYILKELEIDKKGIAYKMYKSSYDPEKLIGLLKRSKLDQEDKITNSFIINELNVKKERYYMLMGNEEGIKLIKLR